MERKCEMCGSILKEKENKLCKKCHRKIHNLNF